MCEAVKRWQQECEKKMAFWEHDGNPARPHLVTTTGEHVNMCYDWQRVAEDPLLLRNGAVAIVSHFHSLGLDTQRVNRVLGIGRDSAGLAHAVAHAIFFTRSPEHLGEGCYSAHLGEPLLFDRRSVSRPMIKAGEHVLVILDYFVPAHARYGLEAVRSLGAEPAPFVGAIFNLSGLNEIGHAHPVGALVNKTMMRWSSKEACALCRAGSEAIRLESRNDWERLVR